MKALIKVNRIEKKLKVREVASALGIDQALVSKFESGKRIPTETQVHQLAKFLSIDDNQLMALWLKEKVIHELGGYAQASAALQMVQEHFQSYEPKVRLSESIQKTLDYLEELQADLSLLRKNDSFRVVEALELEYTFESNRIEGNTLTLKETDLVVNKGLTIAGKSMQEHLEAINHKDAIEYVKQLVQSNSVLTERELLTIHNLVLRGIDPKNAGKYRNVQVMISGSEHQPPQPFLVPKLMEDYFIWYSSNRTRLHPVVLAAEMHERLVTIHPFIDGNGRTSRLIMNLILLQNGYVIANIKGDNSTRMNYYEALEVVQTGGSKESFVQLIAETEIESLKRYISILK
ncbi:MAG: Fic family protein [Crocinitomicaceae bacterium]